MAEEPKNEAAQVDCQEAARKKVKLEQIYQECPYLDTINRKALDFDFENLCSVSLSKVNVYACLVCGKYFQGRGISTHAFTHSVSEFHHIFLNLETLKFYCLPDNYQVYDPSFEDILYVVRPTFSKEDIDRLDKYDKPVQAYDKKLYYPGIVGLNNLKCNDYCNVIFQALSHVIPLRNYFLTDSNHATSRCTDERYILARRFGELNRKLWNPRNFKAHVSPHEMLQAIVLASKKRFEFTKQSDPIVFLNWFLEALPGPSKKEKSVIEDTFQGELKVFTRLMLANVADTSSSATELIPANEETIGTANFMYLKLELPTMPLFPKKDEKGKVINPRVGIEELLSKYNGKSEHEFRAPREVSLKKYQILKLPHYLILYYNRFTKNTFFLEKNNHIVDFSINNLNMTSLLADHDESATITYTLIANIVHEGDPEPGKGTYRVHILHRGTGKWFELQDLYVTEIEDVTLITLSESYIQIWERKS